ncbi:MAG TPA: hypothetical protein VES90_10610 [Candidatus Eisenbacteria bacterium]|nr:hypothetical protein [Candidatus Eisenbacteria bacterium]
MRNHLLTGGIAFLLIACSALIAACGAPVATSNHQSSSACSDAGAPHRAYVVVQHQSGATMQSCVGFGGVFIDGQTLMDRSGIQYEAHAVSSGKVVCQVDFEPRQFSQCFPANQPYWALFIESGGKWTSAPGGFTQVQLHDKEAIGWHYVGALDPAPSPPPLAKKA